MHNKRLVLTALALLAVALAWLLATSGHQAPRHPPQVARMGLSDDKNVIDLAVHSDALAERILAETMTRDELLRAGLARHGLTLRIYLLDRGDSYPLLLRSRLEAALVDDILAIRGAAEGNGHVLALASQGFSSVVARRHADMSALRGETVGYERGSQGHFVLVQGLAAAGLSEDSVRTVAMDASAMPLALQNREIGAFVAPATAVALAEKLEGQAHTLYRQLGASYLQVSERMLMEHRAAAAELVAGLARARAWLSRDDTHLRQGAQWLRQAGVNLPEPRIAAIVRPDIASAGWAPMIPDLDLSGHTPLFKEYEFLRALGPVASVPWQWVRERMDVTVLDEVMANPKRYPLNVFGYRD